MQIFQIPNLNHFEVEHPDPEASMTDEMNHDANKTQTETDAISVRLHLAGETEIPLHQKATMQIIQQIDQKEDH
jgi:hypothetical protein